ncbi:hypothetical protein C8F04DRAFT_1189093 [Mycena alexandri]|uniref:NmrA-like domain-containing protein n=1 Tax=Mycena alexandri TaxID=1745969 RepID=A0AAD6WX41_9AGAR|nr:hypothetical protein C8F04DRAFT_1189093 [Mycena alexandri]
MSAYNSFAVVGGGTVGIPIVNALAAKNVSVVLLSRPGSSAKTVPSGVTVVQVDTSDAAAVGAVLKEHKVDVVLSTVTTLAASGQKPLVDGAKQAGVKLFVPSEYGMPTDGQTEGPLGAKNEIAAYLKTVGIPSARIFVRPERIVLHDVPGANKLLIQTGHFTEFIPWLTAYADTKKIQVVGKGEAPVSFTAVPDIAGFVAHILTTLPPSELENRIFRLEGERISLNGLGPLFNTPVEHVDKITGEMGELKTMLHGVTDTGAASTGWDTVNKREKTGSDAAGSANALWAGHQWKTIKEVHNL